MLVKWPEHLGPPSHIMRVSRESVNQPCKCTPELRVALIPIRECFSGCVCVCVYSSECELKCMCVLCILLLEKKKVCLEAFFFFLPHLRRLIQHSLPLLHSPHFCPIYERPRSPLSVCKHTTRGQEPAHTLLLTAH